MKKLFDIKVKNWWWDKQSRPFQAAYVNGSYKYTIIRETEKAIQIDIVSNHKLINDWKMWIPKSVIENLEEVLEVK